MAEQWFGNFKAGTCDVQSTASMRDQLEQPRYRSRIVGDGRGDVEQRYDNLVDSEWKRLYRAMKDQALFVRQARAMIRDSWPERIENYKHVASDFSESRAVDAAVNDVVRNMRATDQEVEGDNNVLLRAELAAAKAARPARPADKPAGWIRW